MCQKPRLQKRDPAAIRLPASGRHVQGRRSVEFAEAARGHHAAAQFIERRFGFEPRNV
jgi:hypothetical protein